MVGNNRSLLTLKVSQTRAWADDGVGGWVGSHRQSTAARLGRVSARSPHTRPQLDYNRDLGTEGVAALCKGLRTNSSLKQLHLPYCNLDSAVGQPLVS